MNFREHSGKPSACKAYALKHRPSSVAKALAALLGALELVRRTVNISIAKMVSLIPGPPLIAQRAPPYSVGWMTFWMLLLVYSMCLRLITTLWSSPG
ncbi:Sal-Like Protein 3 [Manis pentadactyla]|nr:Sal-Like Protein 3 [Manis pentadactyla]